MAKKSDKVESTKGGGKGMPPGFRPAPFPPIVTPMLPTLIESPFSDPAWIYETKWDGYRAVCFVSKGTHRLISRNQIDMTDSFPEISDMAGCIDSDSAVIDGEIVAFTPQGL